jgi:hypothetical protein
MVRISVAALAHAQQFGFATARDRHRAHFRPGHRLADRLRVGCVVLVVLDAGLHEPRRDQSNLVSEPLQLPGPMVGTTARLRADHARRQIRKEHRNLVPSQLLANHDMPSRIDTVNLEHALCQINADRRNLHGGCAPRFK